VTFEDCPTEPPRPDGSEPDVWIRWAAQLMQKTPTLPGWYAPVFLLVLLCAVDTCSDSHQPRVLSCSQSFDGSLCHAKLFSIVRKISISAELTNLRMLSFFGVFCFLASRQRFAGKFRWCQMVLVVPGDCPRG